MIKHSRGVGSFRVVRAYDACTLPRYIKMKIRVAKAMNRFDNFPEEKKKRFCGKKKMISYKL